MKFIHCADLHIDSKLESGLSASAAKERREELLSSFLRLAKRADELGARAVIIAGDLFDSERVSARSRKFVLDTVKQYPDVDFLLLTGNHDKGIETGFECPENLRIFGKELTAFDYGNVRIAGCGAYADGAFDSAFETEMINIAVLHGEDRTDFSLDALREKNIDYVALGHYHSYFSASLDDRGIYCYSGCLEGRGFDECGGKGYVLIETDEKTLTHTFVPFAQRRVEEISVDMSEGSTLGEQRAILESALARLDRTSMVKVNITGKYEIGREKFYGHIVAEHKDEFFCLKLVDRSVLYINPEDYMNDVSLKGEFIRLAMKEIADENERSRVIEYGLRALAMEDPE